MAIVCRCCDLVLRRYPGLHVGGEPFLEHDAQGYLLTCPGCGATNRYFPDAWQAQTEIRSGDARATPELHRVAERSELAEEEW